MKSILTRGGIEFLAVLLGISGSLWIDIYSKEKEIYTALNQDISNIKLDIQQDLEEINKIDSLITIGLAKIDLFLKITNKEINVEELESAIFSNFTGFTNTFFPMGSSYLVAQKSGRINKIENQKLLKSISKYYQNSYERLKTNNFMYDDFLNINFFSFRAELESKKTNSKIIELFSSIETNPLSLSDDLYVLTCLASIFSGYDFTDSMYDSFVSILVSLLDFLLL